MCSASDIRILVVDDQDDIRQLASMVLGGAGYQVDTAAGGHEALAKLLAEPYDLVLLDINMPDMDGWETLRLIRADEASARLAIIMFSVKGEIRDKMTGLQEGADDYITKPFVVDTLVERVGRLLAQRASP